MRFHVYRRRDGRWTWRLLAGNNEEVATAHRAFCSRRSAVRAAKNVRDTLRSFAAPIKVDHRA